MAEKSNKPESAKTTVVTETPQVVRPSRSSWNTSKLFWGLVLILVGVLALLSNLGIVEVQILEVLRLWPLLIVAAGLSVLNLDGWLGRLLTALFLAFTLTAVGWMALGYGPSTSPQSTTQQISIPTKEESVDKASVTIRSGAGELDIKGANIDAVVEGRLRSNFMSIEKSSVVEDSTQMIVLDLRGKHQQNWTFGNWENDLNLKMNDTLPLDLAIDAGASSINMDLSNTLLTNLDVDAGASSTKIKLGDNVERVNVRIDTGASSTEIKVPRSVGVQLQIDSGLTGKDIDDLEKTGENTYETPGFDEAEKQIFITGSFGLASFELNRY